MRIPLLNSTGLPVCEFVRIWPLVPFETLRFHHFLPDPVAHEHLRNCSGALALTPGHFLRRRGESVRVKLAGAREVIMQSTSPPPFRQYPSSETRGPGSGKSQAQKASLWWSRPGLAPEIPDTAVQQLEGKRAKIIPVFLFELVCRDGMVADFDGAAFCSR